MIVRLDYEFDYNGKTYEGNNIDIGETLNKETMKEDFDDLRKNAICHAFDLSCEEKEKIDKILKSAKFNYCDFGDCE